VVNLNDDYDLILFLKNKKINILSDILEVLAKKIKSPNIGNPLKEDIRLAIFYIAKEMSFRLKTGKHNDDACLNAALAFLYIVESGDEITDPQSKLRTILLNYYANNHFLAHDNVQMRNAISANTDEKIIFEEHIQNAIASLPVQYQKMVLHLFVYPNDISILKRILSNAESISVYLKFNEILKLHGCRDYFTNDLSKILFLSSYYKNNNAITSLLLMFGDIKKLFQFCEFYGGTEIKIPTTDELINAVKKANGLAEKLTDRCTSELTVRENEFLGYLATTVDMDTGKLQVNPILENYLLTSLSDYVNISSKYHKMLLRNSNEEKSEKNYEILNDEIIRQLNIFKHINELLFNSQDLLNLINIINHPYKEKT